MNLVAGFEATVHVGTGTDIQHSVLRHVDIGDNCRILNSVIEGQPDWPVVIDDGVTLINCHVQSTGKSADFSFCGTRVEQRQTRVGIGVALSNSKVLNSTLEAGSEGFGASISYCHIGPQNNLRNFANLSLTHTDSQCNLGSEVSKTLITGPGFVSEHYSSYLSLFAPGDYPILTADGREAVLSGLPNASNIGAGTVFANYGGEPLPAETLAQSPGSAKGTAVIYGAFVCINCRVINRYGQPEGDPSPFDLLRRQDLTMLGFGSFVENKLTGRVPAFSYAGDLSSRSHRLGWVLEKKPGIILNTVKKMQSVLGDEAHRMRDLVEGTLRLERKLLEEERDGQRPTFYQPEQLQDGLRIIQAQLDDGRWAMDEAGRWVHPWRFDVALERWV